MKPVVNLVLKYGCAIWLICIGIPVVSIVSLVLWDIKYFINMCDMITEIIES